MLECAIYPITYRDEGILATFIKVVNAAITAVAVILFTVPAVLMFSFAVNSDIIWPLLLYILLNYPAFGI